MRKKKTFSDKELFETVEKIMNERAWRIWERIKDL